MSDHKYLTAEEILAAQDIPQEEVQVPEWGGVVLVRGLSGKERDALESSMIEGKGKNASVNLINLRAKLVARSVVNEDGKRIFTDEQISALAQKSAIALNRVFEAAQRLSGMSAADVEELTKNSAAAQSADSGSS